MIIPEFKKIFILSLITILAIQMTGQENSKKFKYNLGVGISLLGTGDIKAISVINEIDCIFGKRFEGSFSLVTGRGITRYEYLPLFASSFFQLNTNILFIPININNKYKLKIGTGLSLFDINSVGTSIGLIDSNGVYKVIEYNFQDYSTLGYNLMIENEFCIYKSLSASIMFIGQFYKSSDTNSGAIVKLGYSF